MNKHNYKSSPSKENDGFYTLMADIENEVSQYDFSQFKDKVIYCNCDDPITSLGGNYIFLFSVRNYYSKRIFTFSTSSRA